MQDCRNDLVPQNPSINLSKIKKDSEGKVKARTDIPAPSRKGHDIVNDALGMSDELISEQAYLIARGVRPMMLFHLIDADPLLMGQVAGRIEQCAEGMGVLPFVWEDSSETAWVGYASSRWVFETFRWAIDSLDEPHRSRVLGMLLGYTPLEIAKYDAQQPIRGFRGATRLGFFKVHETIVWSEQYGNV